uniref:ATG8-interacting protein 1 n=1 Tax=Leersia perrieri TaxID=77586 RepID=A0A0D9W278_9ORYZ
MYPISTIALATWTSRPPPPPRPPPIDRSADIRSAAPPAFVGMADNEKDAAPEVEKEAAAEGSTPRGADWEVVSLTASAYAAAPGPGGVAAAETKGFDASQVEGRGSSSALFMSDHFVFPPSEHENLPIETSFDDIQTEKDAHEASTSVEDEGFKNVGGNYGAGSERIQFYDEGRNLSAEDVEKMSEAAEYGSFHAQDGGHGFGANQDDDDGGADDSHGKSDLPSESADSRSHDSGAPCKCWLKKHMSCLYHQAKETNALWSVVVAAALVGLVILGRWHKDKLHINQFKWRSSSAVRG